MDTAGSIVHVITDAGPHPQFTTLFEAGLERERTIVGCVSPSGGLQRQMRELGVRSFALGARSRQEFPQAVARLVRILRTRNARIVHTHLVDGSLVGLLAARLARVPVSVMTAHHSHELPFHGKRLIWLERVLAGPLCDHVIAPSRQVRDTIVGFAGVTPEKVQVVHHGIDLAQFDPRRVKSDRPSADRGAGTVFGAIGRLYRLKNHPALLRAFAEIAGLVSDARLVIAGAGDPTPLAALAASLGISDRVRFLSPRADVRELMASFDVFVHPSLAESYGLVIVEAMAMGLPVVSTPVGIAPEIVEHGRNGFLCASGASADLARGLREALRAVSEWRAIGSAAREAVAQLSAARMVQEYEELYGRWSREA